MSAIADAWKDWAYVNEHQQPRLEKGWVVEKPIPGTDRRERGVVVDGPALEGARVSWAFGPVCVGDFCVRISPGVSVITDGNGWTRVPHERQTARERARSALLTWDAGWIHREDYEDGATYHTRLYAAFIEHMVSGIISKSALDSATQFDEPYEDEWWLVLADYIDGWISEALGEPEIHGR